MVEGSEHPVIPPDSTPPKEPKTIAAELARKLQIFAVADAPGKDGMLPDLVAYVIENFNIDVAAELVDPEYQARLDSAVKKTLQTALESPLTGTRTEAPWKGGHSMVILGVNGTLLAARFVQAEQLKEYGDTTPYALTKALCEAYLHDADMPGGLDNIDNLNHIVRDRGEGKTKLNFYEHIFTGSEAGVVRLGAYDVFMGASACPATDKYLQSLLQLPATSKPGAETLAGVADSAFSSIVKRHLTNPNAPISMVEPRILQETRARN